MKKTDYYDYSGDDIFSTIKEIMNKNQVTILLLFILNLIVNIGGYFIFRENFNLLQEVQKTNDLNTLIKVFDGNFILFLIFSITTSLIATLVLAYIGLKDYFEETDNRSTVKKFLHLIFGYFVFYGILIGITIMALLITFAFFALNPLLGALTLILIMGPCIAFLIYFDGYYRFIPYISMLEGSDDLFSKSKIYLRGHVGLSIGISILFSIISSIFNSVHEHAIKTEYLFPIILTYMVILFISFFTILLNIGFTINGYQREKLNLALIDEEIRKEKEEKEKKLDTPKKHMIIGCQIWMIKFIF